MLMKCANYGNIPLFELPFLHKSENCNLFVFDTLKCGCTLIWILLRYLSLPKLSGHTFSCRKMMLLEESFRTQAPMDSTLQQVTLSTPLDPRSNRRQRRRCRARLRACCFDFNFLPEEDEYPVYMCCVWSPSCGPIPHEFCITNLKA